MKILLIDNYDSFTYNLVHLVAGLTGKTVEVRRNDEIDFSAVKNFDKIILSPGPGLPAEAGSLLPLIREFAASKPMLGVCLGHQAIGEAFGGRLLNLDTVYHGVAERIWVEKDFVGKDIFQDLPEKLETGRYHSWIIDELNFPDELEVTARDGAGRIMAIRHRNFDVRGVQFHPESVLTPHGEKILENWIRM